jgi:hypothetical protein
VFLSVQSSESPDALESSLTCALLWVDRAQQSASGAKISDLRPILPIGKDAVLIHPLAALGPRCPGSVYELDLISEVLERTDPCASGNLLTWLVPRREAQMLLNRAIDVLAPIVARAPDAITVHASVPTREVFLRFRGLAFTRWQDGRVFFDATSCGKSWASARNCR